MSLERKIQIGAKVEFRVSFHRRAMVRDRVSEGSNPDWTEAWTEELILQDEGSVLCAGDAFEDALPDLKGAGTVSLECALADALARTGDGDVREEMRDKVERAVDAFERKDEPS